MSRIPARRRLFVAFVFVCLAAVAFAKLGTPSQAASALTALFTPLASTMEPMAPPVGPVVTAAKSATLAPGGDVNGNGSVNPGDTLAYTVTVSDSGSDATGLNFTDTLDSNLTLGVGSVAASPIGVDDTFPVTVVGNVSIDSASLASPFSVVSNDYLGVNPAVSAISAYDATTTAGGQVVMTTTGANIGKFTYDPPAGFTGTDTFTYTLTDNANAPSAVANRQATVSITVSGMVWFINNNASACTAAGCGRLSNPFSTLAAFNTLNDGVGNHPAANDSIFVYESGTAYLGGVTLLSGQKLIGQDSTSSLSTITGLTPPTGSPSFPAMNSGNGTFTTIQNAGGSGVTLNNVTGSNLLNGFRTGDSSGPSITGTSFGTVTVADVTINNTTGQALSLNTGTFAGTGFIATSSQNSPAQNVVLNTVAGPVNLGTGILSQAPVNANLVIAGGTCDVNYSGTISAGIAGVAAVHVTGGHTGTVALSGFVTANGTGVIFDNADGTYTFTGGSITMNNGSAGISIINGSGGTFSFPVGTGITNPTGPAYNEDTSTATVTFNGQINQANANSAININAKTGGTTTFTGVTNANTSTANAVNLTNNTGGTVNFNGELNLTTTTGTGFRATGAGPSAASGGTINVTDGNGIGTAPDNTISSGNGSALNVLNTTIGASGLIFKSLSSSGGSANGLILNNTGATAGLTVYGDNSDTSVGGNSTGGTIANKVGGSNLGFATVGCGIYLNNTKNVVLRRMTINGTNDNYGIRGNLVNGFTLEYSTVGGSNGTSFNVAPYQAGEGSVYFGDTATNGLSGTATFTKNNISGGDWDNFRITNTQASPNVLALVVKGNTFGLNLNNFESNASMTVENRGTGTINTTLGGTLAGEPNTFTGANANDVNFTGQTASTMDVVMRNNVLSNSHPGNITGGSSLTLASSGVMTFHVTGNTMTGADGSAVTFQKGDVGTSYSGFFDGNTIGNAGVANSGSKSGNGLFFSYAGTGTATVTATNNAIHQIIGNAHIYADNTGGSYTANFDIRGNTLDTPGATTFAGLVMTNGGPVGGPPPPPDDTINVCSKMGGSIAADKNTFTMPPAIVNPVYIYVAGAAAGHTFNLPGYVAPGGVPTVASVAAFINGNNTGANALADIQPNATVNQYTGLAGCGTPVSRPEPADDDTSTVAVVQTLAPYTNEVSTEGMVGDKETMPKPDYMTPLARKFYLERNGVPYEDPKPQDKPQAVNHLLVVGPTNEAVPAVRRNQLLQNGNSLLIRSYGLHGNFLNMIASSWADRSDRDATTESMATGTVERNEVSANATWIEEDQAYNHGPSAETNDTDIWAATREIAGKIADAIEPTALAQERKLNAPLTVGIVSAGPIGTLPVGKSFVVKFTATISAADTNTSVPNQASISGSNFATTTSNNLLTPIIQPLSISKAFGAPSIATTTGVTTLTFTINNPNPGQAASNVAFSDTFPSGMVINTSNGLTNTCNGTPVAVPGAGSVSLSLGTIAAGGSCTLKVDVKSTTEGTKNNTSGTVSSLEGGTGNTASASINVINAPTFTKAFGVSSIPLNTSTSLTITVTNNSSAFGLNGIAFTDTLPAGLVVSGTPNVVSTCSGAVTAAALSGSVSLASSTLVANASCSVQVNVTGTSAGVKSNSVTLATTEFGLSTATATANLTVVAPATISKAFGAASIPLNGSTTLSFTITNPNTASALNGIGFTDTLPVGVVVATPPAVVGACGIGTITAVAGSSSVSLSNGSLTASPGPTSSCTFQVNVTGTTPGTKNNTTGNITSTEGGAGGTASASLNVEAPPYIQKSFASCITPPANMVGWYPGDGNANDIQNGNNATFAGNTFAVGKVGQAFSFNGSGFASSTGDSGALNLTGNQVTLDGWIKPAVDADAIYFGKTAPGANDYLLIHQFGMLSSIVKTSNGGETIVNSTLVGPGGFVPPVNQWTHIGLTYDGATINLYANGILVGTSAKTGTVIGDSVPFDIGGRAGSLLFNGLIDEVEVFNRGLSGNEIYSIFNADTNGKCKTTPAISPGATTPLNFTITNPVGNTQSLTGVAFTDTLPAGLTVANNGGVATCGGTLTTTNPTGIALTGATVAAGGQCTFSVTVTGAASGQYTNVTGNVSSTNGGNGNTATAPLTVAPPPSIAKLFGAATIPLNTSTSLTFNIANTTAGAVALTGIGFTDSLPAGLVVTTPNGLSSTCNGTQTAVAGSSSVSLSGATLAANASCSVTVNVTGTTAGVKNNSVQVTSTEGGNGNTSNANITVVAPPTISKAFGAASIPLGGSTSLTFTLNNPNATVGLTGVAFSDSLPAGLTVASSPSVTNTCNGTVTAAANSGSISLSSGTIASGGNCTITVNVTGTAAGTKNNTTGSITSTEGGTGTTSNTATINVLAPPTIAKAFGAPNVTLNGTTTLTFTLTNPSPNALALTGVAFTDTFPAGLVVGTPNGLTTNGNCGAPAITATAGSGSVTFSSGTIAVGATCTATVNVTGTTSGVKNNVTGNVSSTNGGTGGTASANLSVAPPPSISKSFGAATIPLNTSTSLTFNIANTAAGAVALTGIGFTDSLPAGLVVTTPNGLTSTCNGTQTAVAGSSSVSLSGATLAANASCSVTVNVTGTTAGVKNNSVQVTSTEGGNGNTSNTSITVVAPPGFSKAFGAASIPLGGSTTLTFTIFNPAPNTTTTLTGIGFSDTLPAGLVISTPNGLAGGCGGGTITATQATNVISLSGATLAPGAGCAFNVNVMGTAAGTQNNTTGNVTSTEGGTGSTASASINVLAPPTIAKAFGSANISLNASTSLTFTLTNPAANQLSLTGVAFTDSLPAGLVVATPNGLSALTGCGGGAAVTATQNTGVVSLGSATIAVGGTCTFSVNVTGTTSGVKNNTTGNVSSTNGGTGGTASATVTVATPPTITKAFGLSSIPLNTSTSLTLTIVNPNSAIALTGIAVSDSLPAGLVVATPNGQGGTCTGTISAVAGSGTVSLTSGTLAASGSCTIIVNVTGTTAGVKSNTTGVISSTESGPGTTSNTANITVVAPPGFSKSFGATSIPLNGGVTTLSFTVTNSNTTTTLTGVGFTDTLPSGLVVSTPNGLAGTCGGGNITATAGSGVISLANASLTQNTNCTFSVNVTGTSAGAKNNVTTNITSVEGGNGTTATASIAVVAPPVIAKVFNPNLIPLNGTTSLDFTITNPAANSVALTGVAFTDALPSGLTIVDSTTGVCGGTRTTTAATRTIALSGATIAASSTCTFSVTVTGAVAGPYTNTTGAVTSTNGGTGNTASANLTVDSPPTAVANTTNITSAPGSLYTFSVTYTDDFGVNTTTMDSNDVRVTGPGGYNAAATFTGVNINTTGTPRTATYTIVPPGGGWDIGDNGTYTVVMQANQVTDTANQPVAAGPIGSFIVNIPPVSIAGKIRQYINGGPGDPPLANVTVTISSPNVPVPASTTTNANGDFSFTGLSSGGTYVLTPSGFGKAYDPITRTYPSLAANVANANFVAYDPNAIPRILSIPTSYAVPGQPVDVPVVIASQGTETFIAFSLNYDTNPFATPPTVACGASAPGCTITRDTSLPGKVGVTVTVPTPFNAGPREVARLTFLSLATNVSNSPITFGDAPVVRSVRDGSNNPLPFTTVDGLVVFVQGLEGDLANRKTGDGQLLPNDVTIERQFVVGSILPDPAFNEFQRADTSPSVTKGDGQLDATDIVQERRYVAGLDPQQSAGGLGGPPTTPLGPVPPEEGRAAAASISMRVVSANASPGGKATVAVELDDQSRTVGASFTLNFDPSKLSNPRVELASDAASDTILTVNANQTADGRLGILVDSGVALTKRVVTITFDVAANASGGETPVTFTDDLAHRGVSDANGGNVATTYENGSITISGAAAAGFRVSGRVTTPEGNPLRNATVSITDTDGGSRIATTSSFGFYELDGVTAGRSYTIAVASRRYRFAARTMSVGSDLVDVDFTAQE